MKPLINKWRHYCWNWDMLLIDEDSPEFESCTCFSDELSIDTSSGETTVTYPAEKPGVKYETI